MKNNQEEIITVDVQGKQVLLCPDGYEDFQNKIKQGYYYGVSNTGYLFYYILAHQSIIGKSTGYVIDHVNGNRLDNRKSNLRHVTQAHNARNRNKVDNSSRHTGVKFNQNRWHSCGPNHKFLGTFSSEKDAAIAYDIYVKEVLNEQFNLNFLNIEPGDIDRVKNLISNSKKRKGNSKYRGVCFDKTRNQWIANIGFNKRIVYIGRYNTEEEAAEAYNKKATELLNDKAKLNKIN